MIDVALSKRSY